ncbi:hypothetical protein SAMN02983003_3946 [Devosia enhydra]|uniref:Uncharacterized protein n=1 Tax=Devosia enhydra TaxID=665118 RepID=A0A1K2I350_9HYPH|nr:hypothetical protein [Devosia enhydra]SFZ86752.1 hypothetical protein SAMN02983003_3946 [Devosia enhydra]
MSRSVAPVPDIDPSLGPGAASSRLVSRLLLLLALIVTLAIAQLGVTHPANAETRMLPVAGDHYVPENSYRPIDGSFTSLKPLAPGLDTRSTTRSADGDEPLALLPPETAYPPCFEAAGPPALRAAIAVHPALFVPFFACAPPLRA